MRPGTPSWAHGGQQALISSGSRHLKHAAKLSRFMEARASPTLGKLSAFESCSKGARSDVTHADMTQTECLELL